MQYACIHVSQAIYDITKQSEDKVTKEYDW
jgi:hypothetical protein